MSGRWPRRRSRNGWRSAEARLVTGIRAHICWNRGRFAFVPDMRHLLVVLLASVAIASCAQPIATRHRLVSGVVGGWPATSQGDGITPAPNHVIEFLPLSDGPTLTATSGAKGRYSIDLRPGYYVVRLVGVEVVAMLSAKDPDNFGKWPLVTVVGGRESKLDLIFDTGLR